MVHTLALGLPDIELHDWGHEDGGERGREGFPGAFQFAGKAEEALPAQDWAAVFVRPDVACGAEGRAEPAAVATLLVHEEEPAVEVPGQKPVAGGAFDEIGKACCVVILAGREVRGVVAGQQLFAESECFLFFIGVGVVR